MADILLSLMPNYLDQVKEGEWYCETFSSLSNTNIVSHIHNVSIDVTRFGKTYLLIRRDSFSYKHHPSETNVYVYLLQRTSNGSLTDFKVYLNLESTDRDYIKRLVKENYKSIKNKLEIDECSAINVGYGSTNLVKSRRMSVITAEPRRSRIRRLFA